jgi:hypothetical protein
LNPKSIAVGNLRRHSKVLGGVFEIAAHWGRQALSSGASANQWRRRDNTARVAIEESCASENFSYQTE